MVRGSVAGLSPRRPGLNPRSAYIGFVVDVVALGLDFLLVLHNQSLCYFRRVRKIAKSTCWLSHVSPSIRPSAWYKSATTGRILIKFDIWVLLENPS